MGHGAEYGGLRDGWTSEKDGMNRMNGWEKKGSRAPVRSAGPTPVKQQQQRFHWAGGVNKGRREGRDIKVVKNQTCQD